MESEGNSISLQFHPYSLRNRSRKRYTEIEDEEIDIEIIAPKVEKKKKKELEKELKEFVNVENSVPPVSQQETFSLSYLSGWITRIGGRDENQDDYFTSPSNTINHSSTKTPIWGVLDGYVVLSFIESHPL